MEGSTCNISALVVAVEVVVVTVVVAVVVVLVFMRSSLTIK